MIDLFVILIPLVLLPILLLFVFVGCDIVTGLDEFTVSAPIFFSYDGGLDSGNDPASDLQSFLVEFWFQDEFQDELIGQVQRINYEFQEPNDPTRIIETGHDNIPGAWIGLPKDGYIICTLYGTLQSDQDLPSDPDPTKKKKEKDENPPSFKLERDPDPNNLFRIV